MSKRLALHCNEKDNGDAICFGWLRSEWIRYGVGVAGL